MHPRSFEAAAEDDLRRTCGSRLHKPAQLLAVKGVPNPAFQQQGTRWGKSRPVLPFPARARRYLCWSSRVVEGWEGVWMANSDVCRAQESTDRRKSGSLDAVNQILGDVLVASPKIQCLKFTNHVALFASVFANV